MKALTRPRQAKLMNRIALVVVPIVLFGVLIPKNLLNAVGGVMIYLGIYGFVVFWRSKHLANSERAMTLVGAVALATSYGFVSLAIDSGNNWQYAAAIFLFFFGVIKSINTVKAHIKHHGK